VSRDLDAEITALGDLDLESLRRRWRSLSGKPAPLHLTRGLLVRLIAYRLQAQAYGGLDRETRRILEAIAREQKGRGGKQKSAVPPRSELRPLLPGTHLVREHAGVLHRVMVLEEGFAWNGTVHGSLSEVARAITGTRWNGHRFFGLREPKRKGRGGEAGVAHQEERVPSSSRQQPSEGDAGPRLCDGAAAAGAAP
jgi:hypothetical protein